MKSKKCPYFAPKSAIIAFKQVQRVLVAMGGLVFCFVSLSCLPQQRDKFSSQLSELDQGGGAQPWLDLRRQLLERRGRIQQWVERCEGSVSKEGCSIGDATLFNGLLCLSGDPESCDAVRSAQGADGRLWRHRQRVNADAMDSFSRDMAVGVLAYLVATRDKKLAIDWMNWLERNDFKMCSPSSDNRCNFTPGFWMLFRDVWAYLELPLNDNMNSAVVDDSVMALLQAQWSPSGYQLHLAAVNALIRKKIGQQTQAIHSLTTTLSLRQPENPFFAYLSIGAKESVLKKTLSWCPAERPSQRAEWSFEREQNHRPWLKSMGWECLMLINFLIQDLPEY
jgi:hypothetical protein